MKTALWLAIVAIFFVALPWSLRQPEGSFEFHGHALQWLGLWLMLNGLGLAAWCVTLFRVIGKGTPLPFAPPQRFVVAGPYRVVRNPMALGVLLLLGGQAALYESTAVFLYSAQVAAALILYVRLVEEPKLVKRFGTPYEAYRRHVPGWVPRLPKPFSAARPPKSR
ncbi:MAG: isoprenylcysteine carboxyl methyltransferase [Candidatus Omnitrophica bacterium]|nr:isoprenylcysteine carboxyl methyltransferase [Candidatus Omnitrophota bacterium]